MIASQGERLSHHRIWSILSTFAVLLCAGCWLLALPQHVCGCSVPVFRYALERWQPAVYEIVILHRGPLSANDRRVRDHWQQAGSEADHQSNLVVRDFDLQNLSPADKNPWQSLLAEHRLKDLPLVVIRLPGVGSEWNVVWTGSLPSAQEVLQVSPAQCELVRRLSKGQTAVWILLESGNASQDDALAAKLTDELSKLQASLALPEQDPNDPDMSLTVPLKLDFSLLRISRHDPAESLLASSLLHSESDLPGLNSPMAFPVFGRGRALPGLIGHGINHENIEHYAQFVTGPCACEIKDATPGFDLLLPAEWDNLLDQRLVKERRPELAGLSQVIPPKREPKNPNILLVNSEEVKPDTVTAIEPMKAAPTTPETTTTAALPPVLDTADHSLVRNLIIVVVCGVVLVAALTIVFIRR